ncbi:hypothetical protein ASPBRDRAFT_449364 [Aspergillus brasiliensis CBS 101740]|uniref:Uncharacterized protein n=1 Tax=Aspergillus brasiliensis (strain CBS 101740 / IMI 381727 / IBT 21946) TaxID=767769 RepID=A0A1L9URT8_ASPBC|nr:hypothetical protein ASPBRDRAFT_449364 [Aspergillus brasiliensis CBS 101740]
MALLKNRPMLSIARNASVARILPNHGSPFRRKPHLILVFHFHQLCLAMLCNYGSGISCTQGCAYEGIREITNSLCSCRQHSLNLTNANIRRAAFRTQLAPFSPTNCPSLWIGQGVTSKAVIQLEFGRFRSALICQKPLIFMIQLLTMCFLIRSTLTLGRKRDMSSRVANQGL